MVDATVPPVSSPPPAPSSRQLPLPALGLFLVCCAAMYITAGMLPFLIVLGVSVVASYAIGWRLPGGLVSIIVRAALIALAYAFNVTEAKQGILLIGPALGRNLLGQVAAIEAAIQFWRYRPNDSARGPLMVVLACGVVLLSATNTFEDRALRFLLPTALVLAALTLRTPRARTNRHQLATVLIGCALAISLGVSYGGAVGVQHYRNEILTWGNQLIGDRSLPEDAGMSSQPILGPMFGLRGSAARVLRLEGYKGEGHLRGMAYNTYQRGAWSPIVGKRTMVEANPDELEPKAERVGGRVQVTRLVGESPIVYLPLGARTVEASDIERFDWDPASGGPLRARTRGSLVYIFRGVDEHSPGLLARPFLNPDDRRMHTMVPPDIYPRIAPLAKQIMAGASTPKAKIERVVDFLITHHQYSLTFMPRGDDPVADFLTRTPAASAHCEFFASSSALLLRCANIPTRYVVGYYAHEKAGNSIVVRQKDAHAWCEAWLDGVGWVTVESTPGDGMPDRDSQGVEWWRRLMEQLQDSWGVLRYWLENRTPAQLAALLLLPAGLGGISLLWNRKRRPARTPDIAPFSYPTPPQLAALALRLDNALEKAGAPTPQHLPYSEHLPALPASLRNPAARFLALYDRARYGGESSGVSVDELETALREVEESAAGSREQGAASRS